MIHYKDKLEYEFIMKQYFNVFKIINPYANFNKFKISLLLNKTINSNLYIDEFYDKLRKESYYYTLELEDKKYIILSFWCSDSKEKEVRKIFNYILKSDNEFNSEDEVLLLTDLEININNKKNDIKIIDCKDIIYGIMKIEERDIENQIFLDVKTFEKIELSENKNVDIGCLNLKTFFEDNKNFLIDKSLFDYNLKLNKINKFNIMKKFIKKLKKINKGIVISYDSKYFDVEDNKIILINPYIMQGIEIIYMFTTILNELEYHYDSIYKNIKCSEIYIVIIYNRDFY